MFGIRVDFLFFVIPLLVIVFFGISLYLYCSAKKRNRQFPETFSPEEIKDRKILLIISSVLAGVLLAIVIGFMALLYMAVAFM